MNAFTIPASYWQARGAKNTDNMVRAYVHVRQDLEGDELCAKVVDHLLTHGGAIWPAVDAVKLQERYPAVTMFDGKLGLVDEDGVFIEDPTRSSCSRYEVAPEKTYGISLVDANKIRAFNS